MLIIRDNYERNMKIFSFILLSTFIWGMAAHGFGFMQSSFSHDSLVEFNGEIYGNHFKYQTGRFLSPLNRAIFRTSITMPWLIGILSLLWIALSVFITLKIFNKETKIFAFLLAGVYSTNLTVSCTAATYMHDLDSDMLALLFSVLAVYVWKSKNWGWIPAAVLVTISMAFYQSYITVTIVLVMFVCIIGVLDEEELKPLFVRGMKAIFMLLLGGGMYYIGINAALKLTDQEMLTGMYNTLDRPLGMTAFSFKYYFKEAYYKLFKRIFNVLSPYPTEVINAIALVLLLIVIMAIVTGLINKKIPILEKVLCIILVALLPLAMNLMHLLTLGNTHELMRFAYWLFYLLALLMADWFVQWLMKTNKKAISEKGKIFRQMPRYICMLLVIVMTYSNVQVANIFHLKKDLEQEGYISLMTRVVAEMESYENYEPGITPVVMVGTPDAFQLVIPGFEKYTYPIGMQESDVMNITDKVHCEAYFRYVLSNPAVFAEENVWEEMSENVTVLEMPSFPADGCISMIDNVLIVKLGSV